MENIKHIAIYDYPDEICNEYAPERVEKLSDDEKVWLEHFVDSKGYKFAVINGEIVIGYDGGYGDVFSVDEMDVFICKTIDMVKEFAEEDYLIPAMKHPHKTNREGYRK